MKKLLLLWKMIGWVARPVDGKSRCIVISSYPARDGMPAKYEVTVYADQGQPARTAVRSDIGVALKDAWERRHEVVTL